jgi:hypothetical protein
MLGIVWLAWRGPHVVDDVRYSLATPWPGVELTLAEDGTVELGGRRITDLPLLVHARVESEGTVWETDLREIERERYYDATFNNQYAAAAAQREPPCWEGGRVIRVTVWLTNQGGLYRVTLPPAPISIAM